jgi:nucleotide-binding universal stress UspA family protein
MKILLAIDGSPYSDAAVTEVCRRPWPAGTEIKLLTVDRPMFPRPSAYDHINKQMRAEAQKCLDDAAGTIARDAASLRVTPLLLEGWPSDVILDEAERWPADLIVVGSRGYGAIKRLFLGSVSLAVATGAPCSVEIVRAPRQFGCR